MHSPCKVTSPVLRKSDSRTCSRVGTILRGNASLLVVFTAFFQVKARARILVFCQEGGTQALLHQNIWLDSYECTSLGVIRSMSAGAKQLSQASPLPRPLKLRQMRQVCARSVVWPLKNSSASPLRAKILRGSAANKCNTCKR
eukprot:6176207-Pleurochrysis_carterae.AAC.3